MDFGEYQERTGDTASGYRAQRSFLSADPEVVFDGVVLAYLALGLTGEAGEVANKTKKIIRDFGGDVTLEMRADLLDEIGDCMWYIAQLVERLGGNMEDVAFNNVLKLKNRKERGTIHGSGDKR